MKTRAMVIILLFLSYGDWISSEAASARISKRITVPGDFRTISDAVNFGVPEDNKEWILIKVAPGFYMESVKIPYQKPYVIIEGGGRSNTILAWKSAGQTLADAALFVEGDNFIAKDITFKNTYTPDGPAVAAMVNADKCSFYHCNFVGVHDTLWDRTGRHFFSSCYIEGFVDFICGDGTSIYQDCTINSTGPGYITAQQRLKPDEESGYVFKHCKVVGKGLTYLGRAWGAYSRVLFYKSTIAPIINPKGWDDWGEPHNQLSYSEVDCRGEGARNEGRVPWMKNLTSSELEGLISIPFIDKEGWLQHQPKLS